MKDQQAILHTYLQRVAHFNKDLTSLNAVRTRIAWARFAILLLTISVVYISFNTQGILFLISETIVGLGIFLYAVSKDMNAKEKAQNLKRHIKINEEEIKIISGDYLQRDGGKIFEPLHHAYANDLDIFGEASLYQYLNRCTSEQGAGLLAIHLSKPLTKAAIAEQQDAVKEITDDINWRQQIQSTGIKSSLTLSIQKRLEDWLSADSLSVYTHRFWQFTSYIFPVISLGTCLLYYIGVVTATVFYGAVFIFFLFAFSISKKIQPVWFLLSRVVKETGALHKQLALIEQQSFTNKKSAAVKDLLHCTKDSYASAEIVKLNAILNRFDVRLNVLVFYFLNTFLLWDLQQVLALNNWRKDNQHNVSKWFTAIAETEVLVSIATLAFNQPQWCFPVIADEHFTLMGVGIGHPLINTHKRINNDFAISGTGRVAIITGSNMGGKSTFLRSVGVNMVLALIGAPVCATSFKVSVVQLLSSMRITDNLAESTSTFYAELKKLQTIIMAVKLKEHIFILLDEILRGTNSLDRHTGSAALIKQLISCNAVAVIATHDVALAHLQQTFLGAIANYHFDVQVTGNDLYFDYKLKEGICQSMNASILMKNIGIEIE